MGIAIIFGTLMFCCLIVVLFKIQLIDHDTYKNMANSRQLSSLQIAANRGVIYDRDMNVLAQSATAWTVVVDPQRVDEADREKTASALAEILGVNYETALAKCSENSQYSIIARKVEEDVCDKLREWTVENDIDSISFSEDSKRYYPYGNYLSTVLGFTGTDNYGLYGLEGYFDSTLAGTPGRTFSARNASGGTIYYEYETYYEPEAGNSLVLTIDETVQYYLEKYIEETMEIYGVKDYACGIVMNVKTGEILGMTTKPDYDPNDPFKILDSANAEEISLITDEDERSSALTAARYDQWTNKAISAAYYPGSVFKAITTSMALETGTVTPTTEFYCPGSIDVSGVNIGCNNHTSHGTQTFAKAVANSCNVTFMKIGAMLGSETFFKYFKAFGLTEKTEIDMPGEGISIYYTADKLGPVELATSAFGQSNSLTPIQLVTAFAAAVNGGKLLEPYIVSKIIDSSGNIVSETNTTVKRQVISEKTSATVAEILRKTATGYSAQNAYVKGYRVGGKTGTSEIQGGPDDVHIASFCGFAPAEDPEVIVLVMFKNPRKGSYYGGIVAAPCVGKIFASILPHLGVDPVYTSSELETVDVSMPSVKDQNANSAKNTLTNAGFSVKIVGDGATVVSQFPAAGMATPKGSTVVLYTGDSSELTSTVPNLTGSTYKNAVSALASRGLNVRINGSTTGTAVVTSQSHAAGESVPQGTVVTLQLTEYGLTD